MNESKLHNVLSGFQKPELQDLAYLLGCDLPARVRKSELVNQLYTYLKERPQRWLSHLMERDARLLRKLVRSGPEKVHYMDYAPYPSLLEATGFLGVDDSDEHYHKLWISRELYDIVSPQIDSVIRSGERSGRYRLEQVCLGYMNLYGILTTERFAGLVADYFESIGEEADSARAGSMLWQSQLVKLCRYSDSHGDYMCSPCVGDLEQLHGLRHEAGRFAYPQFSIEQALEAGSGAPYFALALKTPEGMALEQMYRSLGYEGFELVTALHDTWVEAQYTQAYNEALFAPLSESPGAMSLDPAQWQNCCRIVADYADVVPKWALCGQTARETGVFLLDSSSWEFPEEPGNGPAGLEAPQVQEDYPRWKMPPLTVSEGYGSFFLPGFSIPHVAPDDPCPCGSGLRYCRCHGKLLS
ncbi:MAG: SEC-C domain-containing protein [Bacteroidales bacterium]|nr:SEC-C domain-containing protein [Bacteroidales bacterium]MBP5373450.1 SEC-C domain-containing protein [Bacteroidales bacterium]